MSEVRRSGAAAGVPELQLLVASDHTAVLNVEHPPMELPLPLPLMAQRPNNFIMQNLAILLKKKQVHRFYQVKKRFRNLCAKSLGEISALFLH